MVIVYIHFKMLPKKLLVSMVMNKTGLMNWDGLTLQKIPMNFQINILIVDVNLVSQLQMQEEGYLNRAKIVGKELIQKQEMQLMQLIHLLRQVESQVNTSQINILQTLSDHQTSIRGVFKKAVAYISAIHQRGEHNGTSLMTIQLLKHIFHLVVTTLSSVECGVDNLVDELATRMCSPMVDYVKGLKLEVTSGRCHHLLSIVEDMGGAMRTGRLELEEARKKARIAEHNRLEALYKLKESEEMGRNYQGFLSRTKSGSKERFEQEKVLLILH